VSHDTERWLPIAGFEDSYEVSDQGRVRSLSRWVEGRWNKAHTSRAPIFVEGGILQPLPWGRRREYSAVQLCRAGGRVRRHIHHLVLETFVGPRPDGCVGCHNNGVHTDNRLENLRWDTESSNVLDTVTHGTHHAARKTHCKRNHEFTPENTYYEPNRTYRYCKACRRMRELSRNRSKAAA
jgi:hypothetical protein